MGPLGWILVVLAGLGVGVGVILVVAGSGWGTATTRVSQQVDPSMIKSPSEAYADLVAHVAAYSGAHPESYPVESSSAPSSDPEV